MVELFGGIAISKRVWCAEPFLKLCRAIGEFFDGRCTQQLARRLFDRAVTVEEQPLVAADDDAQIGRHQDRITQGAVAADELRAEPEIIAEKAIERTRQLEPFMPGTRQGRRETEDASFVRGHGLARLQELNEHRHRQ